MHSPLQIGNEENFLRPELIEQPRIIATNIIESDADDKVKDKYKWLSNYISGWDNA